MREKCSRKKIFITEPSSIILGKYSLMICYKFFLKHSCNVSKYWNIQRLYYINENNWQINGMFELLRSFALISHTSKLMLKILQDRLQKHMTHELPDIQAGFRKCRGTRDQIANMCWIIEKARDFQKKKYTFCFIDYAKAFDCVDHNKLWKILREIGIPDHLTCLLRNL